MADRQSANGTGLPGSETVDSMGTLAEAFAEIRALTAELEDSTARIKSLQTAHVSSANTIAALRADRKSVGHNAALLAKVAVEQLPIVDGILRELHGEVAGINEGREGRTPADDPIERINAATGALRGLRSTLSEETTRWARATIGEDDAEQPNEGTKVEAPVTGTAPTATPSPPAGNHTATSKPIIHAERDPKRVVDGKDDGSTEASAKCAAAVVDLLENHRPRSDFLPHLTRLETILANVRPIPAVDTSPPEDDEAVARDRAGSKSAAPAATTSPDESDRPSPVATVLHDQSLLANILDFEGCLAIKYKEYSTVVGIDSPRPNDPDPRRRAPGHSFTVSEELSRSGNAQCALMNKLWFSLVAGDIGAAEWESRGKDEVESKAKQARRTKDDPTVPWNKRLYAMVIADDVEGLRRAYDGNNTKEGVGAAIAEMKDDEDCSDTADALYNITVSLAFEGALVGAEECLNFLAEEIPRLWECSLDEKVPILLDVVNHACCNSFLDGPVQGVRCLLKGVQDEHEIQALHQRCWGSIGNLLHLAAARGHKELVCALLEGGFDPSRKCDQHRSLGGGREKGRKKLPLPEDWAKIRGHVEVAELLRLKRRRERPDLRDELGGGSQWFRGTLDTFFPQQDRQYGFISPDPGQRGLDRDNGRGGIFVHVTTLREATELGESVSFPHPEQEFCFTIEHDRQGRPRVEHALCSSDYSYVKLPLMDEDEAEQAWEEYRDHGEWRPDGFINPLTGAYSSDEEESSEGEASSSERVHQHEEHSDNNDEMDDDSDEEYGYGGDLDGLMHPHY